MDRRRFLTGASTIGLGSLAGCLSSVTNSDKVTRLQEQNERLRTNMSEMNSTIDDLETTNSELEEQISTLETERSQLEEDLNQSQSDLNTTEEEYQTLVTDQLTLFYEGADTYRGKGEQEYNTGETAYDDSRFARAGRYWGVAFRSFDTAVDLTAEAHSLAKDEDFSEAQSLAKDANIYCQAISSGCNYLALAAEHYAEGKTDKGDQAFNNAESYFQNAEQERFPPLSEFKSTL